MSVWEAGRARHLSWGGEACVFADFARVPGWAGQAISELRHQESNDGANGVKSL